MNPRPFCFLGETAVLIAILALSVLSTLLSLLSLSAIGRILAHQNNLADAIIAATNFQTRKLSTLTDDVHSALDCLVTVDAQRSESE